MLKINLGDKVKCRITGFTGIVISKVSYLNGCERVEIQPQKLKDGKITESQYVDIQQVDHVKGGERFYPYRKEQRLPGGPRPRPTDMKTP